MVVVFLSLPMTYRDDADVFREMKEMQEKVYESHQFGDEQIFFVHNFGYPAPQHRLKEAVTPNLLYLGAAIQEMSRCNAVVVSENYKDARGCMAEVEIARLYDIPVYFPDGTKLEDEKKEEPVFRPSYTHMDSHKKGQRFSI